MKTLQSLHSCTRAMLISIPRIRNLLECFVVLTVSWERKVPEQSDDCGRQSSSIAVEHYRCSITPGLRADLEEHAHGRLGSIH